MYLKSPLKTLSSNAVASLSQKHATRAMFVGMHRDFQLALTLTVKQTIEIKNANGVFYKRIDRDEIRRIAIHFAHKLNKQVFGVSAAKRGKKRLNYIGVIEGERTHKRLHLHIAIGGLSRHTKWNKFDELVCNAKRSVKELDEQHKLDIMDSGWLEYMSKELGTKDTDNVLWELA